MRAAVATAITIALVLAILTLGCTGPAPARLSYDPRQLDSSQLRWCVRGLTSQGYTVRLCTEDKTVCALAAGWARQHGRSWLIRDRRARIVAVGLCSEVSR